jgi:glycosyltransferase involved in cell wall biosynthesis
MLWDNNLKTIKMERIKLLFDATIIIQNINLKMSGRSGIFWVAYNILCQFSQSSLYQITLLVPAGRTVSKEKNDLINFLSSFPSITIYETSKYELNINLHKNQINDTKNIIKKFIRYLQISKNILNLTMSKIKNSFNDYNSFNAFFSPIYSIPDTIRNISSIKSFHILYDCIPIIESLSSMAKIYLTLWFSQVIQNLNKSTYYFCISENTKKDFFRIFPNQLDESKMSLTPIATSQSFSQKYDKVALIKVLKKYGFNAKITDLYIFSLCSIEPRKNLFFTIKCFIKFIEKHQIENFYFFLGGASLPDYIRKFLNEISDFTKYQDKIIMLGYIDDEDVNILYSNSSFFAFLSQYEGFGMPPLEAMQAGTPVICSNNSSLPEVVGDAAITIPYNDETLCIKAFEDLYFNENLRKYYIEKGLERAKLFTWEKTFKMMSDVIIKAIGE